MNLTDDFLYAGDCALFAERRLGFTPDPWQKQAMQSTSRQIILNCSRQSGKSQTCAAIAVHAALFDPSPGPIICASPSLRQSRELFIKIQDMVKEIDPAPPLEEDNKLSMTLKSGARIIAIPGDHKNIRGISSPRLVLIDECSFCDDQLYTSLRPMLAVSLGKLILLSSPFGRRGFFFETWQNGGPSWERIEVPASQCPRISKEFLEEERVALGEWRFLQEYCCRFMENVNSVFSYAQVMGALSDEVKPLFTPAELALIGGF